MSDTGRLYNNTEQEQFAKAQEWLGPYLDRNEGQTGWALKCMLADLKVYASYYGYELSEMVQKLEDN